MAGDEYEEACTVDKASEQNGMDFRGIFCRSGQKSILVLGKRMKNNKFDKILRAYCASCG